MKYKFYVNDIPEPWPIWDWIESRCDIKYHSEFLKPVTNGNSLLNLTHQIDIDQLSTELLKMLNTFGFKGWKSALGEVEHYGGLSLSMNPNYVEDNDINQQTLGTSKNLPNEFEYFNIENFSSIRNTYYDHYGFRVPSPCVKQSPYILNFIEGFKRSNIRSRLAVINPQFVEDFHKDLFWHRDEPVFTNLRMNIPIKTDPTYMFQIQDRDPVHLQYGNIYSWDTNVMHRVFPTKENSESRVHLVLGFSPWFDYNQEEDSFTSNEFYGEMHPLDMLVNGHVHPLINGLKVGGG